MYLSVSIHLVHIYLIKGVKIEGATCLAKLRSFNKFILFFLHFWQVPMANHFGLVIEEYYGYLNLIICQPMINSSFFVERILSVT